MTKEECFNAPKCAGIYYFKNKINSKYYIGQAVKLRKRLLDHFNHYLSDRYSHIPLYKAFKKHGIENFELGILETIKDALSKETKLKLDSLEKKYIQEYNSHGATGYNCTLGGDAGVLGLKHSEETKNHIKGVLHDKQREIERNPENWYKAKSIVTGCSIISISRNCLAKVLEVGVPLISRALSGQIKLVKKEWIIARYLDEFPTVTSTNSHAHIDKEKISEILQDNPVITYSEFNEIYPINRNTFMRYRKILGLVPKHRVDTKVIKEDFINYYKNHTKQECLDYFGITERRFYKYRKRYLDKEML